MKTAERDHYTYRLSWSAEDGEHVATCAEFPSLSWLDEDEIEALRGIKKLVREAVENLRASGEPVPEALADREFSGRFLVRIPPEQHRALAVRAAEAGVSLNRYVSFKLAGAG
jgi:predicted RNase H-like HicB family nuclease